jgi:hypothetical protein
MLKKNTWINYWLAAIVAGVLAAQSIESVESTVVNGDVKLFFTVRETKPETVGLYAFLILLILSGELASVGKTALWKMLSKEREENNGKE